MNKNIDKTIAKLDKYIKKYYIRRYKIKSRKNIIDNDCIKMNIYHGNSI